MTILQASPLEESIVKEFSEALDREVNPDYEADLRNAGLDSIVTIKLVVNLEVKFDIEIDNEDLFVDNFSSINKISNLLSRKYGL